MAITWEEPIYTLTMFIDGVPELNFATAHASLGQKPSGDYRLGWRIDRKNMVFRGLMRDLQIFGRALSEAELHSIKGTNLYYNIASKFALSNSVARALIIILSSTLMP